MSFILIKGKFMPGLGIPDGDSVRFKADDIRLWSKLRGRPVRFGTGATTKKTVQLRLEGIDAIEKGATKPLATDARDNLLRLAGYRPGAVETPAGYILSRMTDDPSGRPICFAFAGKPGRPDGSDVFLDAALLRKSVNYRQMLDGFAYPLYYNTLFASLRTEFTKGLALARKSRGQGYWGADATLKGVTVTGEASLATIPPVWPKLWRRLQEHFRKSSTLAGFIQMLAGQNERVDRLDTMDEVGLKDLVAVKGKTVRLLVAPENLRVVGKAGKQKR